MAKKWRDLVAGWSPERLARVEAEARRMLRDIPLVRLRHARNVTVEDLAAAMGMTEAAVLRLERRSNSGLSAVRRMVEAMGGELEITARFPDGEVRLGEIRVIDEEPVGVSG